MVLADAGCCRLLGGRGAGRLNFKLRRATPDAGSFHSSVSWCTLHRSIGSVGIVNKGLLDRLVYEVNRRSTCGVVGLSLLHHDLRK